MVRSSDASRTFQPDNQATQYLLLSYISIHSLSGMPGFRGFELLEQGGDVDQQQYHQNVENSWENNGLKSIIKTINSV
jgi:heme-degrading monooxygenase HmoA